MALKGEKIDLMALIDAHVVEFEVEAAGVAHGLTVGVASPQGCSAGVAVGTLGSHSLTHHLWREEIQRVTGTAF